jgi:hypothetical protein
VTEEERKDRARRGILFSAGAFGGGLLLEFLTNVAANYVRLPTGAGGWLAHNWGLLLAGLALAGLITFAIRRFAHERPATRARDPEPIQFDAALPAAVPLIGQDGTIGEVVAQARRHGVVVVYGPAGIGASAVAVRAATELAGQAELQRYVDLRGPNPRHPESTGRSVIRVLSGFGLRPGDTLDPPRAIASIAATMRDSGMVLLLDNAERADQVAWIAHGVRGAYVIVAGDLAVRDLDDGPPLVRVPPLGRAAALALLTRQGEIGRPPTGARRWRPRRPARRAGPGNPVADRIKAEPEAAAELADRYLTFPRLAIEMGRWLAANPQVSLAAVVQDLKRDQQSSELGYIVRRQLDGTSAGARRLLGVLALAPVAELPEAAVAAMTDTRLDRVSEQLAELSSRSLVQWSRPSRCRISPEARQLADRPAAPAAGRAVTRLARYFAALATGHGEALTSSPGAETAAGQQAADWFRAEDVALLHLLGAPDPPARAAPHLWQIAAALDAWFARENRQEDRGAAAEAMARAAASLGDSTAAAIAELRRSALARERGDVAVAAQSLERAHQLLPPGSPWQNQLHSEWAAYFMAIGDPEAAGEHLRAARQTRSRQDPARRVADRINQAGLEIRARELGDAHGTLLQALDVAEDAADLDGQAHAHELLGVVAWRSGHPHRAARAWSQARALYEQASNDHGLARCLQHEGSARLAQPGEDPGQAVGLLRRSLDLRAAPQAGIGVALAHLYLAEAAARGQASRELAEHCQAGLAALRSWTREASEPGEVSAARDRLTELSRGVPVDT